MRAYVYVCLCVCIYVCVCACTKKDYCALAQQYTCSYLQEGPSEDFASHLASFDECM